ncbi:MAG: hypothetical protein HGA54_01730 [Actinobacteria bacterium]|nr:hypothetical protein [Actinomycetota bacterium]
MLQQDYILKMMLGLAMAIREAIENRRMGKDGQLERFRLEESIGVAADMDPSVLLVLGPESMADILLLGSLNDSVAEYIVHALMLDSQYLREDGFEDLGRLREQQAIAITEAFSFPYAPERLEELLNPTGAKSERERLELESQYGSSSS